MEAQDKGGQGEPHFERRQAERIPAKLGVKFKGTQEVARAIKAYSLNFSVGGMCLRTQKSYRQGDPLELTMEIGGDHYTLQGVVAWTRSGAIGVRFVELSEEDQTRLARLVAELKG